MQWPSERDEALEQYATPRQWEVLEALWKAGSCRKAAKALGIDHSTVVKRRKEVLVKAARANYYPPCDMTRPIPDGYKLRGSSTLYRRGEDAPVLQWVKTTEDKERQEILRREMVAAMTDDLPRLKPKAAPTSTLDSLLAVYPIGDHHLGMYAWDEEAGENYDLAIAEGLLDGAMAALTASAPPAKQALVAVLGDFFHYDSLEPVTPTSKNQLDSDGRYALMIRTGIRLIRRIIDLALQRHEKVHVIPEPGNHDLSTMVFLGECLAALYENEPRVTVDTSPRHYHYFEFGCNLIGVHHGHSVKLPELPLVMAADQPEAWGRTTHRRWLTGHIHKDSVVDLQGVRMESFRVLPPVDAWAANKGYRSGRSMVAMVLHEKHGEVARHTVTPEMLK